MTDINRYLLSNKRILKETKSISKHTLLETRQRRADTTLTYLIHTTLQSKYMQNVIDNLEPYTTCQNNHMLYCRISLPMAELLVSTGNTAKAITAYFTRYPEACLPTYEERMQDIIYDIPTYQKAKQSVNDNCRPIYIWWEVVLNDLEPADIQVKCMTIQIPVDTYDANNNNKHNNDEHNDEHKLSSGEAFRKSIKGFDPKMDAILKDMQTNEPGELDHVLGFYRDMVEKGMSMEMIIKETSKILNKKDFTVEKVFEKYNAMEKHALTNIKVCCVCKVKGYTFKQCGNCNQVTYCSKKCQVYDWKTGHKKICGGGSGSGSRK